MSRPFYQSELLGETPIFLLTLDFAGRTFRFSTRPVEITDADGQVLAYNGGLDAEEWEDSTALFDAEPDLKSAAFSLIFPVDIAQLVALGHDLGAATGDFALWLPGTAYEARNTLISGNLVSPEFGAQGEPVAFSLESNPWEDAALTHTAEQRVTSTTWTTYDEGSAEEYYPIVFGFPGVYQTRSGSRDRTFGAPALVVATTGGLADEVLVAGHSIGPPPGAGGLNIYSSTSETWYNTVAAASQDSSGNVVVTCSVAAAGTTFRTPGEYYAAWLDIDYALQAGVVDPQTGNAVVGAGDLLRYMLGLSSLDVDQGRVVAAVPYLNRFKVSGYINDAVSPWKWLQDNLLPLIPVSMANINGKIAPIVWRWDARTADARETLDVAAGISRESNVSYTTSAADVVNDFRLEYAPEVGSNTYLRLAVLTADPPSTDSKYATNLHVCLSQARYGKRSSAENTNIIYDQETAHLILAWKSIAYGYARRSVVYSVPTRYGWLGAGDIILLNDSEMGFVRQLCLVRSARWAGAGLMLTLLILENPPRDTRPT